MDNSELLDAEEMFHLALKASEQNRHEEAIVLLKQSLKKQPNANTQYILAAEHAEIGMLERACTEMQTAIEMDPELWTAHFQLGLLHMMLNDAEQAISAWRRLSSLSEEHALRWFGDGMSALLSGDNENATRCLEKGIEINTDNPSLNIDMNRILENLKQEQPEDTEPAQAPGAHLFLSEYNKDTH